ncbi:platelet endothelial cell adhesion molecule isoform X2 [Puntigrus tetrazona]|uniref:platelet endothelial cell adhesion molecule isoform X2 n=1 Tax=Puntigrus tetrazona TaxID=1606681 RepID=UPI001C8A25F5|nr:platelet endothelial cell adhesion molecule isoform X2 [Puntigrus tetrazona]
MLSASALPFSSSSVARVRLLHMHELSPARMSLRLLWLGLSALWLAGDTQAAVTIDQVTLTVLPANNVDSGTNVIFRCEASVSQSLPQPPTYSFKLLQDDQVVYSKNTSHSLMERSLPSARVSNTGRYHCSVHVYDKHKTSNVLTLSVTGLQIPMLKVKSDIVSEGEDITATCSAPEETGSLMFYFYENDLEVKRGVSPTNSILTILTTQKLTEIYLECAYRVMMHPNAGLSNKSNVVKVIVRDLDEITPQISISPKGNVVEGDRVQIACKVQYPSNLELYLTKGSNILQKSHTTFTQSLVVRADDSGDYVCKAEKGSVQKKAVYHLNVAELFSKPILRMSPVQVFEGESFSLTCSSNVISSVKIGKADIKYALLKDGRQISAVAKHEEIASPGTNGRYYCMAMAKDINKTSSALYVKAKVPVSAPVLRAVDKVIVGKPFRLSCEAENGTLPITYTLLKTRFQLDTRTVVEATDKAVFNITSINFPEEISSFTCQAHNRGSSFSRISEPLRAPVIVPVSRPVLEPKEVTVMEGSDLPLICRVQQGTKPITFTWYHNRVMLASKQEFIFLEARHVVQDINRDQKGDYYCEASNSASETKKSYPAIIGVSLAIWKKALIGVFCILLLVAIVIVLAVFFKKMSHPRRKKQATELSVKPSRPKSGDPMRVSLTLDIEDNTALNGTPCVMGRNVWSENASGSDSDDHTDEGSELVKPQEEDPSREDPVTKSIDPEYSVQHTEVHVSTPGVSEHAEGAALEYAQLNNSEQEPA